MSLSARGSVSGRGIGVLVVSSRAGQGCFDENADSKGPERRKHQPQQSGITKAYRRKGVRAVSAARGCRPLPGLPAGAIGV